MSHPNRSTSHVRRGMTLIEIVIALLILSCSLVWMTKFLALFAHTTKATSTQMRAIDLISNRIDTVRQTPNYAGIDTMAVTQTITMDSTTYKRQTIILHVGGATTDTVDYKIVTVQVSHPSLTQPVRKTTVVAAY